RIRSTAASRIRSVARWFSSSVPSGRPTAAATRSRSMEQTRLSMAQCMSSASSWWIWAFCCGAGSVMAMPLLAAGGAPGLLARVGGAGQALADVKDVGSRHTALGAAVPAEDDDAPLGAECGRRPAGQQRAGPEPVGGVLADQLGLGGGQLRRLRQEGLL